MKERPLILVTNDDGIYAPGIKALVEIAAELGDLFILAPDSPQSAKGHALTISEPLRVESSSIFPDHRAFKCSGTPVDCVKLAKNLKLKGEKIDLCISGINHGSNASSNILYSGTVSAAMEASLEGIDSIGFSLLDYSMEADFSQGANHIKSIIKNQLDNGPKNGQLLNVNIPNVKEAEIKGIKYCRQANARWVEEYQIGKDPNGKEYYWLTGKFVNFDEGNDTDLKALEENYISIVPSKHDLTDYEALEKIIVDLYK